MSTEIKIVKPVITDVKALTELATTTFYESHGHSASKKDVDTYVEQFFNEAVFSAELANTDNIYHLLYVRDELVGYSKIVYNYPIKEVLKQDITKLERIYLLASHHGLGLAQKLLNYNIELAKQNKQAGLWLNVWVENKRAIQFYFKMNFEIVGEFDFKISDNHSNPNWRMFLPL